MILNKNSSRSSESDNLLMRIFLGKCIRSFFSLFGIGYMLYNSYCAILKHTEFNYFYNYKFLLQPLVKFKSHLYYEEKDNVGEYQKNLKPLPKSQIIFFKNGKCVGVAFEDIYYGSYYPIISIYKNATVSVNFGPCFKYSPSCYEYKKVKLWVTEIVLDN